MVNTFAPLKTIGLTLFTAAFVLAAPAMAGDSLNKTSYGLKKQGHAHFSAARSDDNIKSDAKKAYSNAQQDASSMHPADIEPAAGEYQDPDMGSSGISGTLRLPRKN